MARTHTCTHDEFFCRYRWWTIANNNNNNNNIYIAQ